MKFFDKYIGLLIVVVALYYLIRREILRGSEPLQNFFSLESAPARKEADRVVNELKKSDALQIKASDKNIVESTKRIWKLLDNSTPLAFFSNKMNKNRDNDLFNEIAQLDNDDLRAVTLNLGKKSLIYSETNLGMIPITLPQILLIYFKNSPLLPSIKQRLRVAKLV